MILFFATNWFNLFFFFVRSSFFGKSCHKLLIFQICSNFRSEWPNNEQRKPRIIDPYKLYGPHGYRTYSHARCQEVPTVDVNLEEVNLPHKLVINCCDFEGITIVTYKYKANQKLAI